MTAPLAHAHALQYLASGFLRKIEVDNGEIGARGRLGIYRLDKLYRFLAVRDDNELAFNAMLFKGPADQTGIRGIILRKKNGNRFLARLPSRWSSPRGTVKKNVEPLPSSDSTQMRPPARSTIRWQMARPMPVPG